MQPVTCEGCGLTGVPSQITFYQLVTGWKRMFPKGGNPRHQRLEQRFMCGPCVDGGKANGVMWEQQSLFPSEP